MKGSRKWLGAIALVTLSLAALSARAQCVVVYFDFDVDTTIEEIVAWASIEDYFNEYYCLEQAGGAWGYWEHSYEVYVSIVSPTQNTAYDDGYMFGVPYGGGSAYANTYIPYGDDSGEYVIEWWWRLFCSAIGDYFIDDEDDDVVVVESVPVYKYIEYTMFIPLDHVRLASLHPFPGIFSGDAQFTYTPGTDDYRVQQIIVVNMSSKSIIAHDTDSAASLGGNPSTLYGPGGVEYPNPLVLSSSASCYRKFCPECPSYPTLLGGNQVVWSGYCQTPPYFCNEPAEDMGTLEANVINTAQSTFTIRFEGDPIIACIPLGLAADISWLNYLELSWNGQNWNYELSMEHDGFPKHEVRINGVLVYSFDPIDPPLPYSQQTPLSLAPPKEIERVTTGTLP